MKFTDDYSLSSNLTMTAKEASYNYLSGVDHRSFTRAYGVEIDNNTGRATTSWKVPAKYLNTVIAIFSELTDEHGHNADGNPRLPKYMGHKVGVSLYQGHRGVHVIFSSEVNWNGFISNANTRCMIDCARNDDDGGMARAMLIVRESYINRNCEVVVSFKNRFADGVRSVFYNARANASTDTPPLRTYLGDEDIPF